MLTLLQDLFVLLLLLVVLLFLVCSAYPLSPCLSK
jgi:hypothetical protein